MAWSLISPCAAAAANQHERLPAILPPIVHSTPPAPSRGWTIKDIAEVSTITDIKVSEDGKYTAFVVKRPFVDSGEISYGLYVVRLDGAGGARKLAESSFIADLSVHPRSARWTVRADFGTGVGLFDISNDGKRSKLISIRDAVAVEVPDVRIGDLSIAQLQGVLSFEWAPDGTALWYSRLRLRSPAEREAFTRQGVVYDDRTMSGSSARYRAGLLVKAELHVFRPRQRVDFVVAEAAVLESLNFTTFNRRWDEAAWERDSRHIRYSIRSVGTDGAWNSTLHRVDVETRDSQLLSNNLGFQRGVPLEGDGVLAVSPIGPTSDSHLVVLDDDGAIIGDYGAVPFIGIDTEAGSGVWWDRKRREVILAVRYPGRNGLVRLRDNHYVGSIADTRDNLTRCSISMRTHYGACVRESRTRPPEVVRVSLCTAELTAIAQPNKRYEEITPLRTEYSRWVNRYGHGNDGYITYPRSYVAGRRYPAIVVTHGTDARNEFAEQSFQWEFPVQVFAELGYFVLSVNEIRASAKVRALMPYRFGDVGDARVSKVQFALGLDAVASMEAALQALIDEGLVDPTKTGIAGYSRGGEIVEYVMTQSRMFNAASVGDGGTTADIYWAAGMETMRQWQRALYGGSPYDSNPSVLENYRAFSPSFRASRFAGPLLQQYTAATLAGAFELNRLLQDEGVPVELVFFPKESHIFWHPQHRVAAMQRNIDWFNFWLLQIKDGNSKKAVQYQRWDSLRRRWDWFRRTRADEPEAVYAESRD